MTVALVVGAGAVGVRAARQLVETTGIEHVLVADRDQRRARGLADALGERARAVGHGPGDPLPDDVDVVLTAVPADADGPIVEHAIERGIPCASVDDDHDAIERLRGLHDRAVSAGVTVAVGCGLAPGLSDVLARHGASSFDTVDEIRVARTGWAGPASADTVRAERRGDPVEWSDGGWRLDPYHDEQLVWFPDPIGARDCQLVAGGVALLVDAFATVPRISVMLGEPPKRHRGRRRTDEMEWGAARVEVWGARDGARDVVVYGVVERTAVATGTMLAVTAARLVGVLEPHVGLPGVAGLATLLEPLPTLAELSERGVRAARFEGVPVG